MMKHRLVSIFRNENKEVLKSIKSLNSKSLTYQHFIAALVIVAVAAIGSYYLINSFAASPYVAVQAASGTLASPATVQSSGSATNYVQFGSSTSSSCGSSMSAPAGYTSSQLSLDDQFCGTTLNTSNWTTYLGAQGQRWDNEGDLPAPFSGPNSVANGGAGNEQAMFSPSQVSVNNGLTLTAQKNTNQYASTYPWISGVVTTEGNFSLPTTGWYVQVKAEMPDQSQGMWPAIWFLPGVAGTADNEFDGYEGGWLGANPNEIMHSDYFANQGQDQDAYSVPNVNTYNVYGFQFLPGKSITAYVNGTQVWQVNASSNLTITTEPYEIMLELQVAAAQTSGWHTIPTASTPTSTMKVAEVQAYN